MKRVKAIVERAKDGAYSIYMESDGKSLPYMVTGTGKDLEDAKGDFMQGYEDIKSYFADNGKMFEEAEFEFVIDVVSFLAYYASLFSLAGLSKVTGIAQGQLSHYVNGVNKPSSKNMEKIMMGLRNLAKDMAQLG
ncbi:MAG: helix-turn-helix transcriptional regulator [Paludibacteraceae bacterium]|nr:helix-turn-helix transcriptional regulator [Paludibacteraceae bacterium]